MNVSSTLGFVRISSSVQCVKEKRGMVIKQDGCLLRGWGQRKGEQDGGCVEKRVAPIIKQKLQRLLHHSHRPLCVNSVVD